MPETDIQFLARMLILIREGHQLHGSDAIRLQDLAAYGPGPVPESPEGVGIPRSLARQEE